MELILRRKKIHIGESEIREKTGQKTSELGNMQDVSTFLFLSVYILLTTEIHQTQKEKKDSPSFKTV